MLTEGIITALAAVLGILGKTWVDRISARTAEGEIEVRWVQELRAEVAELRKKIEHLEERLDQKELVVTALADFLNELSSFVQYGRRGPYPDPPTIGAEHYNRGRWLAIKTMHDQREQQS